jgi:hypothetical protein
VRIALLPILVALAFLAASCGGDDDDEPTAEESSSQEWVDGFCSAAADWRTSLEDVISGVANPSGLNADAIRDAVDEGLDATETVLGDVRDLGTPDTEAGAEVKQIVDSMASSVETTVDDMRAEFDDDSASVQELLGKVALAAGQLGGLQQELQSSLEDLEEVDTGELRSELDANEDCSAARSGSGS